MEPFVEWGLRVVSCNVRLLEAGSGSGSVDLVLGGRGSDFRVSTRDGLVTGGKGLCLLERDALRSMNEAIVGCPCCF
jgi:hypothetical protein